MGINASSIDKTTNERLPVKVFMGNVLLFEPNSIEGWPGGTGNICRLCESRRSAVKKTSYQWGWWLGRCNTKNRVPTRRGSQSYWNSKPKISTTTSFPQVKLFPDARPHLTSTQKECVNGSLSLGRSVAEIAEILGIDERRVYRYQRTFRIHSHAFPPTKMRQNCRKITEYIMEVKI